MKKLLKEKAINLRRQAFSYEDISKKLAISKSTSYLWTKDISLSKKVKKALNLKASLGRQKGRNNRLSNLNLRYELIRKNVQNDLSDLSINKTIARLLCAMLYWGEGSKFSGRVVFTNSDPEMVNIFMRLFRYGFKIDEAKLTAVLHLHPHHDTFALKVFWSKIVGIPEEKILIYHKKSFGKTVREGYQGCIAVNYGSMEKLKELMYYYKEIQPLLGGLV